jgi:hypothetical protein
LKDNPDHLKELLTKNAVRVLIPPALEKPTPEQIIEGENRDWYIALMGATREEVNQASAQCRQLLNLISEQSATFHTPENDGGLYHQQLLRVPCKNVFRSTVVRNYGILVTVAGLESKVAEYLHEIAALHASLAFHTFSFPPTMPVSFFLDELEKKYGVMVQLDRKKSLISFTKEIVD